MARKPKLTKANTEIIFGKDRRSKKVECATLSCIKCSSPLFVPSTTVWAAKQQGKTYMVVICSCCAFAVRGLKGRWSTAVLKLARKNGVFEEAG